MTGWVIVLARLSRADKGLMIDWRFELELVGRVLLSMFWGGLIGYQRERAGRAAGIRTFAAVSLGSCAFTVVGEVAGPIYGGDPTRIAAQVASGIGFIGAGVILHQRGTTRGLTTAATIWAVAAVGMAEGFGLHILAGATALLLWLLLWASQTPVWRNFSPKRPGESREPDPE